MQFTLVIEVPDKLATQVAPMLERQDYILTPKGGKYGYVVPGENISVAEVSEPIAA